LRQSAATQLVRGRGATAARQQFTM
jgi:hypothetical protein